MSPNQQNADERGETGHGAASSFAAAALLLLTGMMGLTALHLASHFIGRLLTR